MKAQQPDWMRVREFAERVLHDIECWKHEVVRDNSLSLLEVEAMLQAFDEIRAVANKLWETPTQARLMVLVKATEDGALVRLVQRTADSIRIEGERS